FFPVEDNVVAAGSKGKALGSDVCEFAGNHLGVRLSAILEIAGSEMLAEHEDESKAQIVPVRPFQPGRVHSRERSHTSDNSYNLVLVLRNIQEVMLLKNLFDGLSVSVVLDVGGKPLSPGS